MIEPILGNDLNKFLTQSNLNCSIQHTLAHTSWPIPNFDKFKRDFKHPVD